jgi:Ca2+/H+ antiporter
LKKTGTFFLVRDNLKLGLVLGFVTPLLIFIGLYFARFSGYGFDEFLSLFIRENRLITFFGAWCLVGNIALFTYYINTGRDNTAKGIFALSVVYGILILLVKLWN